MAPAIVKKKKDEGGGGGLASGTHTFHAIDWRLYNNLIWLERKGGGERFYTI